VSRRTAAAVAAALVLLAAAVTLFVAGEPADPSPSPGETPTASRREPRLEDGDIGIEQFDLTGTGLLTAQARLDDVHVTAEDVTIAGGRLTAGFLTLEGVVPFAVVSAEMGPRVTVGAAAGGRVRVTRTVQFLGVEADLTATGRVRAQGQQVVFEPDSVDVGGPRWVEEALGEAARQLVTIRHPVEGLPAGLLLERASVVEDGFRLRLAGTDVTLVT